MRTIASSIVLVACVAVVVGRASLAVTPAPNRSATKAERESIALDLIESEQHWRASAKRRFPGDHWSQDDDFHRVEQSRARSIASRRKITLTDVLRAIDEGLRSHPQGRRVTASPCKPRPFYD
jgi:hypothetical protein